MTTLEEAQEWLRSRVDAGATCPCCSQHAKVYKRKVTSGMAQALIIMYRTHQRSWFYLPDLARQWRGRDEANLRFFDLIEEATERRPDGGHKGWWRVTRKGEAFVQGTATVPKYARIYNGRRLSFDRTEPQVSIRDALGTKFSYDDLMAGV
jgi:hypothetical protein